MLERWIDLSVLFGQSASGFNSGEEDNKSYYETIHGLQEARLRPLQDFIDQFILDKLSIRDELKYEYPSIDSINEVELATRFNSYATGFTSLIQNSVVDEETALREMIARGLLVTVTEDDIKRITESVGYGGYGTETYLGSQTGRLKSRNRRIRPIKQSKRTEVWYRERLNSVIDEMSQVIIAELENPTLNDATSTPPLSITAKLSRAIQKVASMSIAELATRLSLGLVNRANQQNKDRLLKTYKNAFDIDLSGLLSDEAIRDDMARAVKENVDLIKSIQTDFINDIGEKVFSNLAGGGRHENLVSLIKERGNISKVVQNLLLVTRQRNLMRH